MDKVMLGCIGESCSLKDLIDDFLDEYKLKKKTNVLVYLHDEIMKGTIKNTKLIKYVYDNGNEIIVTFYKGELLRGITTPDYVFTTHLKNSQQFHDVIGPFCEHDKLKHVFTFMRMSRTDKISL